jgi:hypothetical protein
MCLTVAATLAGTVAGASRAVTASRPYTVVPARYRSVARFAVSYTGSGRWHTVYHSEPPNPGGRHDTNDAHDSSTQKWSLRFTSILTIPSCSATRARRERCARLGSLTGATGRTSATGVIDHTHIDGLYQADNASEHCKVAIKTGAGTPPPPSVSVRYLPGSANVSLTALIPVAGALVLLPSECPGQGDSLDGLENNYFTPGFSFASGFGPQRWFTSRSVVIPAATLHRAGRITIRLSDTAHGTPPPHCAVPDPAYERCSTGGSWTGALVLTRKNQG